MPDSFHCVVVGLAVLLGGLGMGRSAPAQAQARVRLAQFQNASALGVDPLGRLYVADAGRDVVRIFDRDGTERAALGGSGVDAGEFDGPSDLDPTNGQTLYVADAGNGRIQRFSAELQYLEAIPVTPSVQTGPERRVFDDGRDGAGTIGTGRPVAVVSSSGDDTYVVDRSERGVLTFDPQRRPERIIVDAGPNPLREPVALALDERQRLYVADREAGAVYVYDLFGTFLRRLDLPPLPRVESLWMDGRRLWAVCADRVVIRGATGEGVEVHPVSLSGPLRDAARIGETLYLLTDQALYRQSRW